MELTKQYDDAERRFLKNQAQELKSTNQPCEMHTRTQGSLYRGRILDADEGGIVFQQEDGRRAVVALTDGVDSSSDSDYAQAQAKLLRAGLACYLIEVETEGYVGAQLLKDCEDDDRLGLSVKQLERYRRFFDPQARPELYQDFCRFGQNRRLEISHKLYELARREMDDMARFSGGHNFAVADLSGARAAFAQVANELGTQYSLAYYPSNKTHDGRFRQIRVELRNVMYASVRSREGYFSRNDNSASTK